MALLIFMLLQDARRYSRLGQEGEMLLREEQDRSRWDRGKIREGVSIMERLLLMKRPGPYQIQAAISALHAQAERAEDTDWPQIAALYHELMKMTPSPVIELNRAVPLAMADGP